MPQGGGLCQRECVGVAVVPGDVRGTMAGPESIWEKGVMEGSGSQGVFCGDFRCPALWGF